MGTEAIMKQDRTGRGLVLAVFLVAYAVLAFGTWERDLFDADEGRYATVAWHMAVSGDWITPRLNGMEFMDKPPLVYWVQAVLYQGFGRHEFFARTPTVLAGALWAVFIFLFARAWTGSTRTGWYAALLAVTSAAGMIGSRVGPQMDMPLAAAVAGALWAGWSGIQGGRWGTRIGLGVAVGCGLLIKGPLVVAVPMLVAGAWMLAGLRSRAVLRVMFSPLSWAVALLIAAPWYVLVEQANPGWIQHFIEYEHFGRFNEGDHRSFRPFWFYVPIAVIYMMPWASLAWAGWGEAAQHVPWWRRVAGLVTWSPWSPQPWGDVLPSLQEDVRAGRTVTAGRLAWCWFFVAFLLYSLATRKLLNYLLPASAPLFVLLGAQLARRLRDGLSFPWRVPLLGGLLFVGVGAFTLAGLWFPLQTGRLPSDLEAPRWAGLGGWLIAGGLVLCTAVLLVQAMRKRAPHARVVLLLLGSMLAWWCVDHGMARVGHLGSSKRLALALEAEIGRSLERSKGNMPTFVAFKRYPQGLDFYTGWGLGLAIAGGTPEASSQREIVKRYARPYLLTRDAATGHWMAPVFEDAPQRPFGVLWPQALFEERWKGRTWQDEKGHTRHSQVIAIVRWREIEPLGAYVLSGPYAGAGRTDLYLVSNRPPAQR
ncbi:MAG: glycosyltransferase family 39 protein [Planctomycetota bacterium]|nr:glycosyltransferase family 39 protein [Planctomycetota bacterium]